MPHLSMSEILIILVVAVALFGYKKLPEVGKGLGRGIKNFKRSLSEPDEIDITPQASAQEKEKKKTDA